MSLNLIQRIILGVAALSIITMIVYPPTYYYAYDNFDGKAKVFSGYRLITTLESNNMETRVGSLTNPKVRVFASIYHIEPIRLSFQLVCTLLATFLLVAATRDGPD